MTRRRFYAPPAAFAADKKSLTLSAEETRHARDVLRLQSGDEILVFDGVGREFQCSVQTITRTEAEVSVIAEVEPARPESPLELILAIALLKGDKFDLVIQKATELGVKRIVPLDTERADVRLRDGDSVQKRLTRWRRIALEAAKQTGRAYVPEISAPLALSVLSASAGENKLMFSEREGKSLAEATNGLDLRAKEVIALVGPEGGWTDNEIEFARNSAWEIVTLGGRTLRAETAGITVVALLQHRFGDLV
ncbi:MAG: rRNA (uracil1498-N3)-methyltransferase [Blastocatellia bacterium]|jgi:16S rRNA (uracil1498-N3)-methyltransferase|nr:rRNA (uracil1498-N3)-methyltransferase [Blastocatellia bacterium]